MQKVVVLGAAGRVGDAIARAFLRHGWAVTGLARNAKAATLAPGVKVVQADATDRASLIAACAGTDVIVNALNPLYTEWQEKALPMAQNVLAAAKASGATHMLPGNVYNFGYGITVGMREDATEVPSTEKARIRIAMEDLFRQAAAEGGPQTIVLRAGDFYGGTRKDSWLDAMILAKLQRDVFTWPGPLDLPHAFAYLPDLAEAFVALAERRSTLPRFDTFHFAGHVFTGESMKAAAEAAVGRPLVMKGVSWTMLRLVGLFMPIVREIAKMSYLWRTAHSLDGSKLERTVGRLPTTAPVDALRQAIDDLGLDGQPERPAIAA
jgi:nucleoside-diphosphate-sugar epimerase